LYLLSVNHPLLELGLEFALLLELHLDILDVLVAADSIVYGTVSLRSNDFDEEANQVG